MILNSNKIEKEAIINVAHNMCAAARTAPKAKGIDYIAACIITDEDVNKLADEMERLSKVLGYSFFMRDAQNVRSSTAVVLIGTSYNHRELNEGCGYCNYENCKECLKQGGVCVYDTIDLGLAIGSAVGIAANAHIDNRILFSAGRAALSLGMLNTEVKVIMGIPLSATGKSLYFDRMPK